MCNNHYSICLWCILGLINYHACAAIGNNPEYESKISSNIPSFKETMLSSIIHTGDLLNIPSFWIIHSRRHSYKLISCMEATCAYFFPTEKFHINHNRKRKVKPAMKIKRSQKFLLSFLYLSTIKNPCIQISYKFQGTIQYNIHVQEAFRDRRHLHVCDLWHVMLTLWQGKERWSYQI